MLQENVLKKAPCLNKNQSHVTEYYYAAINVNPVGGGGGSAGKGWGFDKF